MKERVVRDGNTVTGGGVTAGVDFAFTVMNEIAGPAVAQAVQLALEYDPKPPFEGGSPDRAPAGIKATVDQRFALRLPELEKVLDRVAPRRQAVGRSAPSLYLRRPRVDLPAPFTGRSLPAAPRAKAGMLL